MKNSYELFVLRGYDPVACDAGFRERLLRFVLSAAGARRAEDALLLRTPKGKPYLEDADVYFSISHSGDIWACLAGPSCCGLDIQIIRPCNYEKIAGRFFSAAEREYVAARGRAAREAGGEDAVARGLAEGFFTIWTRREAWGKYVGEGFFAPCPELTEAGLFREFDLGAEYRCAACFGGAGDAEAGGFAAGLDEVRAAATAAEVNIREVFAHEDCFFVG